MSEPRSVGPKNPYSVNDDWHRDEAWQEGYEAAAQASAAPDELLLAAFRAFWQVYWNEIGHYEGATPEFTCIKTEDAARLEPFEDAVVEALAANSVKDEA